jgi:hypothetical protein
MGIGVDELLRPRPARDYPQPIAIPQLVSLRRSTATQQGSRQGNWRACNLSGICLSSLFEHNPRNPACARLREATTRAQSPPCAKVQA